MFKEYVFFKGIDKGKIKRIINALGLFLLCKNIAF